MSIIAKCAFGMTIENLGEKDNPLLEKAKALFTPPQNKTFMGIIGCKGTKFRIYFRKIETYTSPILISYTTWKVIKMVSEIHLQILPLAILP